MALQPTHKGTHTTHTCTHKCKPPNTHQSMPTPKLNPPHAHHTSYTTHWVPPHACVHARKAHSTPTSPNAPNSSYSTLLGVVECTTTTHNHASPCISMIIMSGCVCVGGV